MHADIEQILISRADLQRRVVSLAEEIQADYGPSGPEGAGEITLVPIMTGSLIFVADLIRHLPWRMQVHLISASSYGGKATVSSGEVRIEAREPAAAEALADRHVLLVDDVLDSGSTLRRLTDWVLQRGAASVRTCVLLRKQIPSAMAFPVHYVGFDIPDAFVVGYGLDYDGYYRNLPEVVTLKHEALCS